MNSIAYTPLQIREVFHLEFLRWFGRKLSAGHYALKGGVNLRLFFQSMRYSEDMDLDLTGVRVAKVQDAVMSVLAARGFADTLKSFGVDRVVGPDLAKAKQTETTQRFKIHLLTAGGEDLFTKIEFSRRSTKGAAVVEPVSVGMLRAYKLAPLLVPHYDAGSAIQQKIQALAQRSAVQARDIFDLFVLSSQYDVSAGKPLPVSGAVLKAAHDHLFLVEFPQFRDTVVAYLAAEDQRAYASSASWDEIKLHTAHLLEELTHDNA